MSDFTNEIIEFNLKCKMKRRWANQFLSMLKRMQQYGSMGCSRVIGFYSDGDGDFNPKFTPDFDYTEVKPVYDDDIAKDKKDAKCDVFYDAG